MKTPIVPESSRVARRSKDPMAAKRACGNGRRDGKSPKQPQPIDEPVATHQSDAPTLIAHDAVDLHHPRNYSSIDCEEPTSSVGRSGPSWMEHETDFDPGKSSSNLIVAVPVSELDDHDARPGTAVRAVEYFPNTKSSINPISASRFRATLVTALCFLALVGISITIVVNNKNQEKEQTADFDGASMPTPSPTARRDDAYKSYFSNFVGEKVYHPGTPQYSAADWILNKDPMHVELTDQKLPQRFMLAFLYMHMSNMGKSPWRSCNPPKNGEDDSCKFQEFTRLDDDSIAYAPRDGTRWLSSKDECFWEGVDCGEGSVVLGWTISKFSCQFL
jgi:hypothetical protein